jgi:hypothetical protein
MTLSEKIMALYPQLEASDFRDIIQLRNNSDGTGDYIAAWDHPTFAKPTEEQL